MSVERAFVVGWGGRHVPAPVSVLVASAPRSSKSCVTATCAYLQASWSGVCDSRGESQPPLQLTSLLMSAPAHWVTPTQHPRHTRLGLETFHGREGGEGGEGERETFIEKVADGVEIATNARLSLGMNERSVVAGGGWW
mgnify:CR=1 FL=1